MIRINDLENVGFNSMFLHFKSSSGDIKIVDDYVEVINPSFYDDVFLKCINSKDDFKTLANSLEDEYRNYYLGVYELIYGDFKLGKRLINSCSVDDTYISNIISIINGDSVSCVYDRYSEYLDSFVKLLDKHINAGNYRLCGNVIEFMMSYDNCFYLSALRLILDRMEDNLDYIVDPFIYRNKTVLDNYRAIERKLVFKLELGLYEDVYKMLDLMRELYQDQTVLTFDVISLILSKIRMVSNNRRMLSSHNELGVIGDTESVLIALLSENDFYRVIEIVNNKIVSEPHNIKYVIYKKLIDILKYYLDRNNDFVNSEMELRTVNDISVEEIVMNYPLSSIKNDLLANIEDVNTDYIDDNTNYYEIYRNCVAKKDYKGALDAIRKFQVKLRRLGSSAKFDYIEKDMMVRIQNQSDDPKNIELYEYYLSFANQYRKSKDFEKAICYYYDAFKYCIKRNALLLCKVAECYVGLNDLTSAIKMYELALTDYMYPEDILKFMDVLLSAGQYERVIQVSNVYEEYYPLDNPRVHYMLSICYLHLQRFGDAIAELWNTENINDEIYGVKYELAYEFNIINRISSGEDIEPFNMSTFVDFEMSEYDKRIKRRFSNFEKVVNDPLGSILSTIGDEDDSFDNKMKYLFSLLKIFVIDNDEDKARKIHTFIGDFIERGDVSLEEKTKFTLSLKNYRNL